MSFFEFPHTRTYDSDLGWIIQQINAIKQAVVDSQTAQELAENAQRLAELAHAGAETAQAGSETAQRLSEAAQAAAELAQAAAEEAERGARDYADHIADPVSGMVSSWLAAHVDPSTGYVVDNTLSISGAAADAATVGNRLDILDDGVFIVTDVTGELEGGYADVTNGQKVSGLITNWARTGFIEIDPDADYYYTGALYQAAGICGYSGANVNYYVAPVLTAGSNDTVLFRERKLTIPSGVTHIIASTRASVYSGLIVKKRVSRTLDYQSQIDELEAAVNRLNDIVFITETLDLGELEEGYVDCRNGQRSAASASFLRTGFVPVEEGKIYYYSGAIYNYAGICGYSGTNVNYFVASILDNIDQGLLVCDNRELVIPSNVKYIIASTRVQNVPTITIVSEYNLKTDLDTKYAELSEKIGNTNIEKAFMKIITGTNTKITLVGDSITAGVGGTDFAEDGELIISAGRDYYRNPDGYCWANMFKEYIETYFSATVTNNGCSGTDSTFLRNFIATLIPADSDIVIISYGTNDRKRVVADNRQTVITKLYNNFDYILDYCKTNDIIPVIITPTVSSVADETNVVEGARRWIHLFDIANYESDICLENSLSVINMYNLVSEYIRFRPADWAADYLSDTLHPNDAGYAVMYRTIMNALGFGIEYDNLN